MGHFNAYICQVAKDAQASQDILIDIFERIEMFFRRLEIYTELPSTMEMMDTIIQVMAEVLSILGIATKEIRQGRMSKYLGTNMRMLTEGFSEKYVKTLIGKMEMEDALKRLDRLTQEEARMAAAENLKATHAVDERVKGVADTVVAIDRRVAGVDDRVANVGDQVADVNDQVVDVSDQVVGVSDQVADVNDQVTGVGNQVAGVDDRVAGVNDRVVIVDDRVKMVDNRVIEVITGMQIISSRFPKR